MKKFLCAVLAICMLCGATALVGCKKDKGNGNGGSQSSVQNGGNESDRDNIHEAPGEWNSGWGI